MVYNQVALFNRIHLSTEDNMKIRILITALVITVGAFPALAVRGALNLSYSTYLGGTGNDQARGISVGRDGTAYIVGDTTSADFPTETPYQAGYNDGGNDVFVTALDSAGSRIVNMIGVTESVWGLREWLI